MLIEREGSSKTSIILDLRVGENKCSCTRNLEWLFTRKEKGPSHVLRKIKFYENPS